jgi:hypothetical protein
MLNQVVGDLDHTIIVAQEMYIVHLNAKVLEYVSFIRVEHNNIQLRAFAVDKAWRQ